MADQITLNKETFEKFYTDLAEIIFCVAEAGARTQNIMEITLREQINGKNFYISETAEQVEFFYAYLFQNISQLNSFYSKAFEYLQSIASLINITDEGLAKMLENHFSQGDS